MRRPPTRCPICLCPPLELLSVRIVATQLGVCERTIRRLIADGSLDAIRVRRLWRIRHGSLDAYLESHSSAGLEAEAIGACEKK